MQLRNLLQLGLLGVGLTPAASRQVKPMPAAFKGLVPPPTDNIITIKSSEPDVEGDTMPLIIKKAKRTLYQTKKLAAKLKGSTLAETLRNDDEFILKYIKYVKDDPNEEQIRSPRRLVYEGKGDCDCFATFLASVLTNQGIKFRLRITKYANSGTDDWSHIYIVVPKDQSNTGPLTNRTDYYVLDPVTNKHDYEVAYKQKRDYTMGLQYLDGFGGGRMGACPDTSAAIAQKSVQEILKLQPYIDNATIKQAGLVPTQEFLDDHNIGYSASVDPNNGNTILTVSTPTGDMLLPTIITPEDSQNVLATLNTPPAPATTEAPTTAQASIANAGFSWWGALILAGGALLSASPAVSSTAIKPSLGKLPKRRKMRTVNI